MRPIQPGFQGQTFHSRCHAQLADRFHVPPRPAQLEEEACIRADDMTPRGLLMFHFEGDPRPWEVLEACDSSLKVTPTTHPSSTFANRPTLRAAGGGVQRRVVHGGARRDGRDGADLVHA